MSYLVYIDDVMLPITPSKITMKITNKNKSMTLIDDNEINILKSPGLTEIDFDVLLPNVKYPFAIYEDGFKQAYYYLEKLKNLKQDKQAFQFIVTRETPNNNILFNTNLKVSLEDYQIKEDAKQGFDVVVSVKLKQYRDFTTKICTVSYVDSSIAVANTRNIDTSPKQNKVTTYTVVKGDSLWAIAKKQYGNGNKYTVILEANGDKIKNANLIYPGQILTLPAL